MIVTRQIINIQLGSDEQYEMDCFIYCIYLLHLYINLFPLWNSRWHTWGSLRVSSLSIDQTQIYIASLKLLHSVPSNHILGLDGLIKGAAGFLLIQGSH